MSAKLKLASDLPPRDPARIALAEAIAARDELARQLDAAKAAAQQAMEHKWSAQDKLDAVRKAKAEAAAAQNIGTLFIASVAAGQPCGVDVLERPSDFARDEAALEREVATWAETQAACTAAIPSKESALSFANANVDFAVHPVVAGSGLVATLLEGFEALREELDRRYSELKLLEHRNMIPEADLEGVASALRRAMFRDDDPICDRLRSSIEALKRDADAQIPGDKI